MDEKYLQRKSNKKRFTLSDLKTYYKVMVIKTV